MSAYSQLDKNLLKLFWIAGRATLHHLQGRFDSTEGS